MGMILGVTFLTGNDPSHLRDYSIKGRTWSSGMTRYLLAGGVFNLKALMISYLATMLSISLRPVSSPLNRSCWVKYCELGHEKDDNIQKTRRKWAIKRQGQ